MTDTTQYTIGADASCSDGICGEVSRVVVDPVARLLTHLVVEPKHRHGPDRLVPLDLVEAAGDEIHIRCTQAEFEQLDPAEKTEFLPGDGSYSGYRTGQVLSWPYYSMVGMRVGGLTMGGVGVGGVGVGGLGNVSQPVTHDTVPLGEVSVRRGDHVHATDGHIGKVQGLVIDPGNHHVTHVLLQEGHLWGRKEVAIPINAVVSVDDGIRLNITKQDVQNLPPVDIDHPNA